MRYTKDDYDRISQKIKERVTIPMVWERIYGSIPLRWNSCHCPWREDKHPSFAVSPDGKVWLDRGTGDKGDVFNFYQKAKDCSTRQAWLDLSTMAGGDEGTGSAPQVKAEPVPRQSKRQHHPKLRVPSANELTAIGVLRSISTEGLQLAVARGFLWMTELEGFPAFVVTDKSRKCYVARKLDGTKWERINKEPYILTGSSVEVARGNFRGADLSGNRFLRGSTRFPCCVRPCLG